MITSHSQLVQMPAEAPPAVPMELIKRHLGIPPCASLGAAVAGGTRDALKWLNANARSWTFARQVDVMRIEGEHVVLDGGPTFSSRLLAQGFAEADVTSLVILAVSAGPEVDEQVTKLWEEGRPDDAMMLNAVAISTVEHLRSWRIEILRRGMRREGKTILPHYSPGYHGWDLPDQAKLYRLLCEDKAHSDRLAGPLQLLDSGMLLPTRSTLAALGASPRTDIGHRLENYWGGQVKASPSLSKPAAQPRNYAIPEKALKKWAQNCLQIETQPGDRLRASFRYHGSTCSNMGLPVDYDFHVVLSRNGDGHLIIDDCDGAPVEGDTGCEAMCAFQKSPDDFLSRLRALRPYVGHPLDDVLDWKYDTAPSGCLCSRAHQHHKWRMVFQTVHYALNNDADLRQTDGAEVPVFA